MKGMDMRIHKLEYLIAGVLFLLIGLFGTSTDRTQTLFIFYVLGLVFLVIGITRSTTTKAGRRHS
jgi:uncharacterized membrane protein HdeD (DUF308 family)